MGFQNPALAGLQQARFMPSESESARSVPPLNDGERSVIFEQKCKVFCHAIVILDVSCNDSRCQQ
jgi:hypothetical protein